MFRKKGLAALVLLTMIVLRMASRQIIHYVVAVSLFESAAVSMQSQTQNDDDDGDQIQFFSACRGRTHRLAEQEHYPLLFNILRLPFKALMPLHDLKTPVAFMEPASPLIHPPS